MTNKERNKYMSEWYKKPENRKKKNAQNKIYRDENWDKVRMWEKKSQVKHKEKERNRNLKRRYGITIEDYDLMFENQKGVCAICGGDNTDGKRLHIDHNHKTGIIRGLLCNGCNRKLGWYEILYEQIHKYLKTQG